MCMQILLIESEPKLAQDIIAKACDRFAGVRFLECSTLQEGIELLEAQQKKIDLVICDYRGQSLARRLRGPAGRPR